MDLDAAMDLALEEAAAAMVHGDVPIGAVALVDGEVVAALHVHGPSYRFPGPGAGDRVRVEQALVAAAARVSIRLRQTG